MLHQRFETLRCHFMIRKIGQSLGTVFINPQHGFYCLVSGFKMTDTQSSATLESRKSISEMFLNSRERNKSNIAELCMYSQLLSMAMLWASRGQGINSLYDRIQMAPKLDHLKSLNVTDLIRIRMHKRNPRKIDIATGTVLSSIRTIHLMSLAKNSRWHTLGDS